MGEEKQHLQSFYQLPSAAVTLIPFSRRVSIGGDAPTPVHFSSLSTPLYQRPLPHTHLRIQIGSALQSFTPSLSWLNWDVLIRLGWDKQDKIPAFESLLPLDPQAGQPGSAAPHLSHMWSPGCCEYGRIKEADSLSLPVSQHVRLGGPLRLQR